MAENQYLPGLKGRIMEKIVKTLGVQSAVQKLPNELLTTIQPVLSVESDKEIKIANLSGDGTFFTSSKTKRTFITGIGMIGGDGEFPAIGVYTLDGSLKALGLVIGSSSPLHISYNIPIEIMKNRPVIVTGADIGASWLNVMYYEED